MHHASWADSEAVSRGQGPAPPAPTTTCLSSTFHAVTSDRCQFNHHTIVVLFLSTLLPRLEQRCSDVADTTPYLGHPRHVPFLLIYIYCWGRYVHPHLFFLFSPLCSCMSLTVQLVEPYYYSLSSARRTGVPQPFLPFSEAVTLRPATHPRPSSISSLALIFCTSRLRLSILDF
jgi:hypothetical protein